MRWLLSILAILTLLIIGGFITLNIAKNNSLTLFENIGFTTLTYQSSTETLGGVRFNDITLDQDNISTIGTILTSFALGGESNILIKNANLTADTLDGFTLDGFNGENFPYTLATLNIKTAILKNTNLSILTKDMGGLTASIEARANKTDTGLTYQSRITSAQQQFTIKAQATGTITPNSWASSGDIEQAKFDLPQFHSKITRTHGKFTASGAPQTPQTITASLSAGGYQLFNTPWKNATAALKIKGSQKTITLNTRSIETEPLELTLSWKQKAKPPATTTATLRAPTLKHLRTYLEKSKKDKLLKHLESLPGTLKDISISFEHITGTPIKTTIRSQNRTTKTLTIPPSDFL